MSANAIREDETAAAAMGINVVLVKVSMFAFGAAIAGVGGGLYAMFSSFVLASNFSFHLALISIFYVAVGGMYRFYGPIVGAILLTALLADRAAGDLPIRVRLPDDPLRCGGAHRGCGVSTRHCR